MASNIVVFLSDDHAQWASGCYGNGELRTPTLDYLADTGVLFENAYTPSPVCSPARASFLTGRLPSQHGVHDYLADADEGVRATPWLRDEKTLPDILHDAGYVTGLSGKWHLGGGGAKARGFDYWYARSAPVSEPEGYEAPWPLSDSVEHNYDRHAFTTHALEFLHKRDTSRPFFLLVGHLATHSPWSKGPERLVDQYRNSTFDDIPQDATYPFGRLRSESLYESRQNPRESLAQYYGAVSEIDEQVGRVIDELEMLGIRDDTAVIYTADHGLNTGHHGVWGKGNGTLPYNVLEESIRVPLIVNHPGAMVGGQRRAEAVSHLDTFQTILDIAGVKSPRDTPTPYPGRSYEGALRTLPLDPPHDLVFAEYGTLRMVRSGTLKLVRRYPDGPTELFDLDRDPRESTNVLEKPQYARELAELRSVLDEYFRTYEEPSRRGVDALEQPRHNGDEAWRDSSAPVLTESAQWLDDLEESVQNRRRRPVADQE